MVTATLQFTADTFNGSSGSDQIDVGSVGRLAAHDTLTGGAGVDTLRFVATNGQFDGAWLINSSGWDKLDFTAATAGLTVKLTAWSVDQSDSNTLTVVHAGNALDLDTSLVGGAGTVLLAGTGLVTLRNFEGQSVTVAAGYNGRVNGGSGGDVIAGASGTDSLSGFGGADTLSGGAGADTLDGGAGADRITLSAGDLGRGGIGVDLFIIAATPGAVTIQDFADGEQLSLRSLDDATAFSLLTITSISGGARVQIGDNTINLTGVAADSLTAADFIFAEAPRIVFAAGSSQASIQAAINDAPPGTVIELGAGTFTFTQTLNINRSDISLVGAGSGQTVIVSAIPDADASETILVKGHEPLTRIGDLATDATAGATTLTLASAAGLKIGDAIYLVQDNDEAWLEASGNGDLVLPADHATNPSRYALREVMVEVTAINGSTVTLSHALPFTFEADDARVHRADLLQNVELSGFRIVSDRPPADTTAFVNTRLAWSSIPTVSIDGARDTHLSDIVIEDAASHGFEFQRSFGVTGENLTVDGAHNKGDSGNGYAFYLNEAFAIELSNIRAFDVRHAVLTSSWSAEHFNTVHVADTNRDINFHGSPDADNTITIDRMVQTYAAGGPQWSSVSDGVLNVHPLSAIADNDVTFRYLRGGNLGDVVHAADGGADIGTGGGADRIWGGSGNDTLDGGQGIDTVTGGAGRDRFVRTLGSDDGLITDFQAGASGDVLVMRGYAVQSMADLHITQSGADTLINFGQDGIVTLQNTTAAALTDANFEFAAIGQAQVVIAEGGAALVMGSDGADHITVGRTQILAATPVIAGSGEDVVALAVGSFVSETRTWGGWRGVDVLDFRTATSIAITFDDAILTQADDDALVLRYGATTAVTINVGAPLSGKLVLEGSADVTLAGSRAQMVFVSDVVGGRVNGGSAADTVTGGALDDVLKGNGGWDSLIGGQGADFLDGGLGFDTMIGGAGGDIYVVDSVSDVVTEAARGGVDEVRVLASSYSLAAVANVERLTGISATGQTLVGNGLANVVNGAAAGDRLEGLAGRDELRGNGGADTLFGGAAGDTLYGGEGADRFVFTALGDSLATQIGRDVIHDFSRVQGDRIDLSAVDAVTGGSDDAFTLASGFTGVAGQLTLTMMSDHILVQADADGDRDVDFSLKVMGTAPLGAVDFIF